MPERRRSVDDSISLLLRRFAIIPADSKTSVFEVTAALRHLQYEDGEETKSDFLARMILEGRIDYDAEKKYAPIYA